MFLAYRGGKEYERALDEHYAGTPLLPDGQRSGAGGPDDPVMQVARPADLFRRLGLDANIGFGEAHQAGDWSSPQLADLLTALATHLTTALPFSPSRCRTSAR